MNYDKLLALSGELGCHLLLSGAEIYRVEESVRYLLGAYGVETGEVFAIPNCIIVSLTAPEGRVLTWVRRVPGHDTDISKMEDLNALCRRLCANPPELDEAAGLLDRVVRDRPQPGLLLRLSAYFLITSVFCLFFGGTAADALCGGLCGLTVGLLLPLLSRLGANLFFRAMVGGLSCGVTAAVLTALGLGEHLDLILTGAIMTQAPGLVVTNCMRDLMAGDVMSSLVKLSEGLLTGAGIALGTGVALGLARTLWGGL
ncbi:threonine/serine exporter family protein [uncultured Intestinimonas sp.]|uniref:threonine/serine exporter family protein n=1 Tax=uncultured Intestinimonas sp. TaxID=1689265 RepID=UPI0025DD95C6|nr:threonine/serine exporter family protein [uncultured Intestinimonas sp.]